MHPNSAFRAEDRAVHEALLDQIGFSMVFAQIPDGPRVAHTPLILSGAGRVRFHLARGNALAKHLDGASALLLVNGPDGYVSPRWYIDPDQVPTWNYVALELEGPVRRIAESELLALLEALSARHEARVSKGVAWTMDKLSQPMLRRLLAGIVGFELEIQAWRPTYKLSQNKSPEEHARVVAGLETAGQPKLAALMRARLA